MELVSRNIAPELSQLATQYPVVTITGPRQSGKTTLARTVFPDKPYFNLENPDTRQIIQSDPRSFFNSNREGAIIDEFQKLPEILSYIQGIVDEKKMNGQFILTGSNQLSMLSSLTQSLAGRTALLTLLPFSFDELSQMGELPSTDGLLYQGFYPGVYANQLNATKAYRNYYETYIERDVRQLSAIQHLSQFQLFIKLCAGRVGQLFNASNLANEVGVSIPTIKHWISVLQATYIVFLLQPWHTNVNKRLVKTPKLYFYDPGLASYLLGIESQNQIATHPLRGALFENMVVVELIKSRFNNGLSNNFYFYRDNHNNEVDLVQEQGHLLNVFEIKSSMTFHPDFLKGINYLKKLTSQKIQKSFLIYAGNDDFVTQESQVLNYSRLIQ